MNILDTRDLAKRLEELQDERNVLVEAIEEAENAIFDNELQDDELDQMLEDAKKSLEEWDASSEFEEMTDLENLESEISEWSDGATLIDESDFVEYCQELLEDIGDLPRDMPGYIVIDWDATADNLRADYTTVTYQGTDYLVRA